MAQSVFPIRETDIESDSETEVVSLGDSGAVIEALTSRTARDILSVLQDEPLPPSEIADRTDTSLQNATHHLTQMDEAGLVDVVDRWYSSRGHEMDVYAPVSDSVVICLGSTDGDHLEAELADVDTSPVCTSAADRY